jgi:diacylglycerol kinase family enzyme
VRLGLRTADRAPTLRWQVIDVAPASRCRIDVRIIMARGASAPWGADDAKAMARDAAESEPIGRPARASVPVDHGDVPTVTAPGPSAPLRPAARLAAVVVNPTKVADGDALRSTLAAALTSQGWAEPVWLETSEEDPGYGMTEQALEQGVGLVMACGGDGTVRAALTVLAGTGVPLAVLPAGTGNLLARNLGIPVDDLTACIDIALNGADRTLDVGRIEPTEPSGRHERFAIMAGVGLDAAIMRDAPERLKARIGWPAYVVSAAKHLRRPGVRMQVVVDGRRPVTAWAQTVVIGNMGMLQGGIELLTDAVPDDGVLDVAVLAGRGLADWSRISARVLTRRTHVDDRFRTYRGRRVSVTLRHPQPRQVDGDLLAAGTLLAVEVEPRALVVRVAVDEGDGVAPPRATPAPSS